MSTMNANLFREERMKEILQRVRGGESVYVNGLAEEFGVSRSSIRLDLGELERRGMLQRTHGGAFLGAGLIPHLLTAKSPFETRNQLLQNEKDAIGRTAAELVADNDTLFIDGGSTTNHVARFLGAKRGLTIITNATSILSDLEAIPDAEVYLTGGRLHRGFSTLIGEISSENIRRFRTAKAILGMDGISLEHGLSVTDPLIAESKRQMMAACGQLIVVCDHTKLNQITLYRLAPLEAMYALVTDADAPAEFIEAVQARGPLVVRAPAVE
jgi:DeoR/GlpR family transcriptional regulator of sugar metabolism